MKNIHTRDFKVWNDAMVRKYDPDQYHHHPNPLVRYIEAKRVRRVIDFLELTKAESLLEVGCGAGNILEGINCCKAVGADLSLFILGKARGKKINSFHPVNATAESLPFQDRSFNKIICSEVLEHVLNPQNVLIEIWRVLKDDGKLIISIPNESLINSIKKILRKLRLFILLFPKKKSSLSYNVPDDMTDEWHLHELNISILNNMLKNYFTIVKYKGIPFNILPLRYVLQCQKY